MPADHGEHAAGPHDRDRLLAHRHLARPVRVALPADPLLVEREVELWAPAARHLGPDDVVVMGGRAGRRAHLGDRDEAGALRERQPQHEVGEGQVGQQLPVRDQLVQPVDVVAAEVGPAGCDVLERGHAPSLGGGRCSPTVRRVSASTTADLVQRDLRALWHPFTQHSVWAADDPMVVDRAEGMHFWDTDGNRYLDGVSSLWVTVHGHQVPEIDAAIRAQLERLAHTTFLGLTHEPGIELAERLLATAPAGLTRVFYAGDGSSAVEAALKMAYQAGAQRAGRTGAARPLYLHVAEGYHGDTIGAVSVGGVELFHATYRPILLETRMVPSPGVLGDGQTRADRAAEVLAEMRAALEQADGQVCAVVIEPLVQAAGGMLTHDVSFVRGVRELCDELRRADGRRRGRDRHRAHRPDVGRRARRGHA